MNRKFWTAELACVTIVGLIVAGTAKPAAAQVSETLYSNIATFSGY